MFYIFCFSRLQSIHMMSEHITVTEIKEEDFSEEASGSCQQNTLSTEGGKFGNMYVEQI